MGAIINGKVTARIEGDFVVFLIGMRINKVWKPQKWGPVAAAMPRMLKELAAAGPTLGCLGTCPLGMFALAQYWRSFDHLEAYARSRDHLHLPAWAAFNKRVGKARDDVGIWHETYQVRAGEYETVYSGMPPFGLAAAAELVPIGRDGADRSSARARLSGRLN